MRLWFRTGWGRPGRAGTCLAVLLGIGRRLPSRGPRRTAGAGRPRIPQRCDPAHGSWRVMVRGGTRRSWRLAIPSLSAHTSPTDLQRVGDSSPTPALTSASMWLAVERQQVHPAHIPRAPCPSGTLWHGLIRSLYIRRRGVVTLQVLLITILGDRNRPF